MLRSAVPGIIGNVIAGLILELTGSWPLVFATTLFVLTSGLLVFVTFARSELLFP